MQLQENKVTLLKEIKSTSSTREDMMKKRRIESDIKKIETVINDLEKEIAILKARLESDEIVNDYEKYNELTAQIEALEIKLESKMEEWEARSLDLA